MSSYILNITTPVDIPDDVLVEHVSHHLLELLLTREEYLTFRPIDVKLIGKSK